MDWTGAHRAFTCAKYFLKTSEFVIAILGDFQAHFLLRRNDAAPDRKSIL